MINKSREQDTGVKLEVNDKILDNCTALMKTIKILIMKAKELQQENEGLKAQIIGLSFNLQQADKQSQYHTKKNTTA